MARRIGYSIRQMRSGRWQVLVRAEDGKQVGLGSWERKQDAERAGLEAVQNIRRRAWIDPRTSDITLLAWLTDWQRRMAAIGGRPNRGHSPRHAENVASLIRRYVEPEPIARVLLTDLRPGHVAHWYDQLAARLRAENGRTGIVAAKTYRTVHAALKDAVDRQLIPSNPAMISGAGKEDSPTRPLISGEQVAALAATITPRYSVLVLTAAWSGLRLGELGRLERRDVDLLHGTLTVRQAKSKAGERTVHVPRPLVELLERHLEQHVQVGPDALVFTGERGGRLTQNVLRKHWRPAADACGLEHVVFHDLRHYGATSYAMTGATLREVMAHIGHSTQQASLRYQHRAEGRGAELASRQAAMWIEPPAGADVRQIKTANAHPTRRP